MEISLYLCIKERLTPTKRTKKYEIAVIRLVSVGGYLSKTAFYFYIMQKEKRCIKCGVIKPLSDFYLHKGMADGHLNKCKECTKHDVSNNYAKKSKDESWVIKERERGREKYRRLGYSPKDFKMMSEINKIEGNTSRDLRALGVDTKGKEAHHWNYNMPKSVFLLSRKSHRLIHKFMVVNRDDKFCYTHDGIRLETKNQAKEYFKTILREHGIQENLDVINY